MGTITGSEILAKAMKSQGIDTMFYFMGGPMLETEAAAISLGIRATSMTSRPSIRTSRSWPRARRGRGRPR